MKLLLINIIEKIHFFFFGHRMGSQMKDFMANLSWSFFAGIIATPISMVIGTLAGRYMGPIEYGRYNLVLLISSIVVSVACFGLDISTLKRIVKTKSKAEQQSSFYSSFVFILTMLIIFSIAAFIVSPKIIAKTNLPHNLFIFVIIYSCVSIFKSFSDVLIRALEKFKVQAIGRIIEISFSSAVFVLAVLFLKKMDYGLYLLALISGICALSFYYLKVTKDFFKNFSFSILKEQLSEGRFFMLSGILSTVFISSDRLLIAKYFDAATLGIYSAYYVVSLGLVSFFLVILSNVLLPATAKLDDKTFTIKIDRLFIKGFAPIYLLVCAAILFFINIFGKAYPLKLSFVLLFALVATLYLFNVIYTIIIFDADRKRYIQYFYLSTFVNLVTIGYYFGMMQYPSKSIPLVLVGFSVNLIINLTIQQFFVRVMRAETLVERKF